MTFIHAYLLGGLLLAGVPVLLHLMLRQKPKRLPFPAFRFLKARQKINQRRIQLQHFLLLFLRILLIALVCFALARPRLNSGQARLATETPVVAVLLFDTSPSMEYAVAGETRLQEAIKRGRELLDEMNPDSRVAIADSGDDGQVLFVTVAEARTRVDALRIRWTSGALNASVDRSMRALAQLPNDNESESPLPRLLYVFSDRTRACWDASGLRPRRPETLRCAFVDVGVEEPKNLGINQVEIVPSAVAPGANFEIRVGLAATPTGHENELSCLIENDPEPNRPADRWPVQMNKGLNSDLVVFKRVGPANPAGGDMVFQVKARLAARDFLPADNLRHASFLVRGSRKLLTIVEKADPQVTRIWRAAHGATKSFTTEIMTTEQAEKLTLNQLGGFSVIAIFQTARISDTMWEKLTTRVRAGAGLLIVPGGEEINADLPEFNKKSLSVDLAPAEILQLTDSPKGLQWERFSGSHPLMAPFVNWTRSVDPDFDREDLRPFVRRYRKLGELQKGAIAIARYSDRSIALAERPLGEGKVITMTSPLDSRWVDARRTLQWNNYWEGSFGLVLIDQVCRYLAGETALPQLNFRCGDVPQMKLQQPPILPITLSGPGIGGAEQNLRPPGAEGVITAAQATMPGNYAVFDGNGRMISGFSLDIGPNECRLERLQEAEIVEIFGPNSLIEAGKSASLGDLSGGSALPPFELLPYLMLLVLAILTGESYLANRFYRRVSNDPEKGKEAVAQAQPPVVELVEDAASKQT